MCLFSQGQDHSSFNRSWGTHSQHPYSHLLGAIAFITPVLFFPSVHTSGRKTSTKILLWVKWPHLFVYLPLCSWLCPLFIHLILTNSFRVFTFALTGGEGINA